jgi:F-type H+-transporting ATPase subunit b
MNDLISNLGIDYRTLIFQTINFLIVFGVIYYFFSKPLSKILEERKIKIEEGFKKREEAERLLGEIRELKEKIIKDGEEERLLILKKAQEEEKKLKENLQKEIEHKKKIMLENLLTQKELMLDKLQKELEREGKKIIIGLAQKIFDDQELDRKFIEKLLSS